MNRWSSPTPSWTPRTALAPRILGGGTAPPTGAPAGFGTDVGYRHETAGPVYVDGWYADTVRRAHDVQVSTAANPLPERGVVLGVEDARLRLTTVVPDDYWLMPATVRDPIGLERSVTYNYRSGQVHRLVDANGTATNYRYNALSLLASTYVEGRAGEGGTEDRPEVRYTHDFGAFARSRSPIFVRIEKRVWHASAAISDEQIESREYVDGFGRLLQRRTQADEVAFGTNGDDVGLFVAEPPGSVPRPIAGRAGGPAVAQSSTTRVVVSGWEVTDNKGRVVEKYEPFFDDGWDYRKPSAATRGRHTRMFYDPRGHLVRVLAPDGSERRTVMGAPHDVRRPDEFDPSPWVTTSYDENDLAPISLDDQGQALATRAPAAHAYTPSTTITDALGRSICQLVRAAPIPRRLGS